jgi:translation elongation factor EF-G
VKPNHTRGITDAQQDSGINMANKDSTKTENTLGKRSIESSSQPDEKRLKQASSGQENDFDKWNKHYNKRVVENALHKYTCKPLFYILSCYFKKKYHLF